MTVSYGDWQPGRLRLAASELYVLLHGPDAKAAEVFKLALHELIGRGVLKPGIFQQGSGRTTTRTALLLPGTQIPRDLSWSLRSVKDAYDSITTRAPREQGVAVQELAHALREQHGASLGQWVTDDVVGALVDRGLFATEEVKRLGLFSTTKYEPTPEGKAARAELEASIKRARDQFPTWASHEPARAATFLALAGPAVLIMPDLRHAIERFHGAAHGARKMMVAGSPEIETIADMDFDIYRLSGAPDDLKTLDDAIDYGRLEHHRPDEKETGHQP
jgi:hypothetical protein